MSAGRKFISPKIVILTEVSIESPKLVATLLPQVVIITPKTIINMLTSTLVIVLL